MKFGENEILEREKRLFSSEHRFINRMRLDALCFQLFLTLGIVAVLAVCLAGAFRGIINSAPEVGEKQILTSSRTTVLYDKDGNELQRLDGSGIRQDYVKLEQISVAFFQKNTPMPHRSRYGFLQSKAYSDNTPGSYPYRFPPPVSSPDTAPGSSVRSVPLQNHDFR